MKIGLRSRFVTLNGDCFEAELRDKSKVHDRDGIVIHLILTDLRDGNRQIQLPVRRFGPRDLYTTTVQEYDNRELAVLFNVVRDAFDSQIISFGAGVQSEIRIQPKDFLKRDTRPDADIRRYIIHKAYWLGYRHPTPGSPTVDFWPISFAEPEDLEYTGSSRADVLRVMSRLRQQGLLENVLEDLGRPSERLLSKYEANDWAGLGTGNQGETPPATDEISFARMAIEQAKQSIAEDESKPHPSVGVVAVKNGRVIATAYRGEVPANHAEFVALEHKLTNESLAGATVYTTLEPCTTRNHPKIPCAERLIERRVGRVVIGILDPDKRITGQGYRKLLNAGIRVDFFPSQLVPEILELNRNFIRHCDQLAQVTQSSVRGTPEIEIVFEPSRKPFLAEMPSRAHFGKAVIDRRYRVGIRNRGDATIQHARVVLESCSPDQHHGIHPGHALQLMGAVQGTGEFALQPGDGPSEYVDVAFDDMIDGDAHGDGFGLCYAALIASRVVPRGTYVITLRAEGDGAISRKTFKLFQDADSRKLMMVESDHQERQAAVPRTN